MAIDPKEIYIGAHYYNGGYVKPIIGRITAIYGSVYRSEEMNVGLIYDMPLDEDSDPYEHTMAINLEPIPITEELLSELGFDKKMFDSDWSMWTKDFDSFSISVGIQNSECKGANIKDDNDEYAMCGWSYPCRYLHELESFYYHCTKQELIND